MKDYSDIIDLPHHVSEKHPRMSLYDRAAQFSPFSALSGYESEIAETGRFIEERVHLDEQKKRELDSRMQEIITKDSRRIRVFFFIPDERKEGGSYKEIEADINRIDAYKRIIVLSSGDRLPFEDIIDIESIDLE